MTILEFYYDFFLINLNEFPNIGIDLEINKVLLCFLIGLIITTITYNYRTAGNISLVKKLLRHDSTSEENSKTLHELGLDNSNARKAATSSRLRRIVKLASTVEKVSKNEETEIFTVEKISENKKTEITEADKNIDEVGAESTEPKTENEQDPTSGLQNEKIDFATARFYIDESRLDEAKKIADISGITPLNTVLNCILLISIYVFLLFLMPSILTLINNILA